MRPRGRTHVPSFALILLLHELLNTATTHGIPPITCLSIVSQILIFLRIIPLPWHDVWDVCLSADSILRNKEYIRIFISQLSHADDWHLYYNMVSFLWKGRSLERRFGSFRYALTLIVFTISTGFVYVLLNKGIAEYTEDYSYLRQCSVGFSGVIFALKVLTTSFDGSSVSHLMGLIPISSKYAVWAELVLISLISPNASFVGHLAGILVGLAYINGPLKYIIDIINGFISSVFMSSQSNNDRYNRDNGSYRTSGRSGHSYENTARHFVPEGMSEDEQLRRATEESLYNWEPNQPNVNPSAPQYPTESPPTDYYYSPPYPTINTPINPNSYDPETIRRLRLRRYQN